MFLLGKNHKGTSAMEDLCVCVSLWIGEIIWLGHWRNRRVPDNAATFPAFILSVFMKGGCKRKSCKSLYN